MGIKWTKQFPYFFPSIIPNKQNQLNHLESLLEQSRQIISTLSTLDPRSERRRGKKGEVCHKLAKREEKEKRNTQDFPRWDAGTRWITTWRPRPRERVRFFSRKNGFSMSVNSVAETAQSRLTRAPRPLENTTRGMGVNWWTEGRWRRGDVEDSRTSIDSSKESKPVPIGFLFLFLLPGF